MGFLFTSVFFGAIAALSLASRQRTLFGFSAVAACAITSAWAWSVYAGRGDVDQPGPIVAVFESLRLIGWVLLPMLLMRQLVPAGSGIRHRAATNFAGLPVRHLSQLALMTLAIALPLYGATRSPDSPVLQIIAGQLLPAVWLGLALGGLVQLERVYRQADPQRRRAVSLLCLSLGTLLAVDFLFFTDVLLFRRADPLFLGIRGWIDAALAVPVAVALARTPERAMQLHVSRPAVTASSAVLLAAGLYLLLVAAAGYALRLLGISADGPLQVVFGVLIGCVLVALTVWPVLRKWLAVMLAKHLFSYKYDYRQEWLSFTGTLADDHLSTPKAILSGLCRIVNSPTGALWARNEGGALSLLAEHNMPRSERIGSAEFNPLQQFLVRTRWLVDLDEYRRYPDRYDGLSLPQSLLDDLTAWLLVPLPQADSLLGVALIGRSPLFRRIDWEDRDLLKAAGHQGAGQLALFLATEQLAESREFDAFNRASAYIVHDLKNLLGQQTLIVANAERHRHKPAFVDDVIETIEHSVSRMNALLQQLERRHGNGAAEQSDRVDHVDSPSDEPLPVELSELVKDVCRQRARVRPVPVVAAAAEVFVAMEPRSLARIVGHLVQNAQEASSPEGVVAVSVTGDDRARVVVRDEGTGMSEAFIRDRLFRAFDSTKGLTGMGVGVFEVRDSARRAGGDLTVVSREGQGSTFTLELPLAPSGTSPTMEG